MMSLTFGLFTQVSGSGPLGPLVCLLATLLIFLTNNLQFEVQNAYPKQSVRISVWCLCVMNRYRLFMILVHDCDK